MVDKQAVTLVGAGLVGSLAAILLARRCHRVDVYEGRLDPRKLSPPPGRSVALVISARGWKTLRAADILWQVLALPNIEFEWDSPAVEKVTHQSVQTR